MEDLDDEVGITMESSTTSSWLAAEGTLDQSVKVVEESEDAIYTAGATSRLVLVQPSSITSEYSSSEALSQDEPCELTVTFKKRYNHIHQIYVLSTARICEIYGQKEEYGDRDYVCTVRGGIIYLADDEDSADDTSNVSPDAAVEEDLVCANTNSNFTSSVPLAIPKLASGKEAQARVSPSEDQAAESVTIGKMESSQPIDESSSITRRDSADDLFRSFTEASNGKTIEGSAIFEESLDHTEWIECPHSPTKSIVSTGDEETEVDITKSGFYFIDPDVESQKLDHPQVLLFPDAMRDFGKDSTSHSLERAYVGSSGHSSWQEVIDEPTYEKGLTDATSPRGSTSERDLEETHTIILEPYPPSLDGKSVPAQVDGFTDDVIGENLPRSGFGVFEVNQKRDSSSVAMANSIPCESIADTGDDSTQVLEAGSLETDIVKTEDMESRYPVEAPVYECEVELEDADAWTSVTIRLLSIKSKNEVQIHRVVVTYTPGPPIQSPVTTSSGPFQQGVGSSSLSATLILGILQMARGIPEPRIAKNSLSSSAEKGIGGSDGVPSKVTNGQSSSPSQHLPTVPEIAVDVMEMNKNHIPPMADTNLSCEAREKTSYHSEVAEGDFHGTSSVRSVAHGETQGRSEFEESQTVNEEIWLNLQTDQKEERVDELVQRLDRLEKICLRMENSLNASLESMNKRLEALERMPPVLGPTIWGPGFDSGSFVSAASVYVPAAQMGPGTPSLIDSPVPKMWYPPLVGEVPVGESSAKGVSETHTPVYPSVPSSTTPPYLSSSLPSSPVSSLPQHVSPDSSSHSSGLTASFITKSGLVNRSNGSLHGSEHLSIGGETYWESRTSAESKSDVSSESEQTSYADNCEDPACGCCPESLSSSPTNPALLVDNALASALSAFSASFGAQNKVVREEVEFYLDEESDEEDSFTSEEQVPLVELESVPCFYEKEGVVDGDVENIGLHGYEAIPLSSDKDTGDLAMSKVIILEENFWPSEFDENQQMNWQDDELQNQEEKSFGALKDSVSQTEEGTTTFDSSSPVFIQVSDQPSLADSTTDDPFSSDLERVFENSAVKETEGNYVGQVLEAPVEDAQENPFLQELVSGGDVNAHGTQSAWHQQDWTGEQTEIAKNVLSSYLTAAGLSKPFDSHEEMLQEGLFPDDWNWFTSEFSPFSSLVEVTDLSEDVPVDKEPVAEQKEAVNILDGVPLVVSPSHMESWSLLDGDVSMPRITPQLGKDIYGQDWLGQKSQWSLLDGNPPDLMSGDMHLEAVPQEDGSYGNKEPRSLLDEDISAPSGKVPSVDNDVNLFSSDAAFEEHLNLTGAIQSSKYEDMAHSPSSEVSRSNPFEDEFGEGLDFSQGSNNAPLVLLDELEEEVHEFEGTESKGTESLLFHLSL